MTSDRGEEPSLAAMTPIDEEQGSALPAIAAKADDLEEIKKSVEDAAAVSGGLWLSYLFVLFYIAIAAGAVTHEDFIMNKDCPVSAALTDDDKAKLLETGNRLLARAPVRPGYAERP